MYVTIESQKELDELIQKLQSETLPIDLTIILPYQARELDQPALDALGGILLSKNINSLHMYIRYIYSEHKNDDQVWKNVVIRFARAVEQSPTLKHLDLSQTHLTFIQDLVAQLRKSKRLLSLNLSGVAIGGHSDQTQGIQQALNSDCSLQTLNLSGNYINRFDLSSANSTLTALDLSDNLISDDGIVEIAQALESSRSLKSLTLAKNKLSPSNVSGLGAAGIKALAKAIERNSCLEHLELSHNNLTAAGIIHLSNGLRSNTALQSLDLSNNSQIGDEGGIALAQSLKLNKTIIRLDLSNTGIGDRTILEIAAAIDNHPSLQILHLAGNSGNSGFSGTRDGNAVVTYSKTSGVCTPGARALAKVLENNRVVRVLDLNQCSIDTEGMLVIAKALENNAALRSLHVSNNGINNAVAILIANAVAANSCLRSLNLQGCWFGDEGFAALARALCTNTELMMLDVRNNDAGTVGLIALADALEKNFTIKSLYLGGKFEDAGVMAVVKALARNVRLSEKLENFNIFWSTVYSAWYETRWDSTLACSQGIWSYEINGTTIASSDSFVAFMGQIKSSSILPNELKWFCDIPVSESTSKKVPQIAGSQARVLSSTPPVPRERERSSSVRPVICAVV
ncbi:MAG: hypothetical protein LLG04_04130 [Parachlamydia sp.]|nr:hypothetical protein [Parachlamydia sp.]